MTAIWDAHQAISTGATGRATASAPAKEERAERLPRRLERYDTSAKAFLHSSSAGSHGRRSAAEGEKRKVLPSSAMAPCRRHGLRGENNAGAWMPPHRNLN